MTDTGDTTRKEGIDLSYCCVGLAETGERWKATTPDERFRSVSAVLNESATELVEARADGAVILRLTADLPASERGPLLLGIENELRCSVAPGLEVWLEPKGDRNRLRLLRGIVVQA